MSKTSSTSQEGFGLTPDELEAKQKLAELSAGKEQMGNFRKGPEEAALEQQIPGLAKRVGRAITTLLGSDESND